MQSFATSGRMTFVSNTATTAGHTPGKGSTMDTMTRTFVATTMAADPAAALAKVERYLARVPGFATTGVTGVRSERHGLWTVEIADLGGDVNDAWVVLTSYGISPAESLGSVWQSVKGVGC